LIFTSDQVSNLTFRLWQSTKDQNLIVKRYARKSPPVIKTVELCEYES
jgi:hypothetical protein